MSDMSETDKVMENRLRRAAQRKSLLLAKSHRRQARAHGLGMCRLVDETTRVWLFWSDVGGRVLMRPVPRTGRAAWH